MMGQVQTKSGKRSTDMASVGATAVDRRASGGAASVDADRDSGAKRADAADGSGASYSIGELARDFGLTHRTLRHYEEAGLLSPARRGTARLFSRKDRARLSLICRGKRLGFSLGEIAAFLNLYVVDAGQMEQMRFALGAARDRIRSLEEQRRDIDQTLVELRAIEADIKSHLDRQDGPQDRPARGKSV